MMGLGTELPLLVALGFLVLGPKRMQQVLAHIAKAKTEIAKASRDIKSRVAVELNAEQGTRK
jgi:Sec-independent protein translocase protein TatA